MTRSASDENRAADADDGKTAGHAGSPPTRLLSHPLLTAAMVPLGLAAVVIGLILLGTTLARTDAFRSFHNRYWLWALGGLHANRWMLLFILPPTWWLITRLYRRNVGPWWRWAGRLSGAVLLVVTAAFTAAWLFAPYGLSREAPLLGTLLLGTLIYLILKIIWADLPVLYDWYRRPLRRYLDASPRGEAWFSILESFHDLESPSFLSRPGVVCAASGTSGGDATGDSPRNLTAEFAAEQSHRSSVLDRFSRVLPPRPKGTAVREGASRGGSGRSPAGPRRGGMSQLLRCVVPPIPAILADHDPVLYHELQERADFWRSRLDTALWDDRQSSFLPAEAQQEARRAFLRLVATTDALAECHIFGLPAIPTENEPGNEPGNGSELSAEDAARLDEAAPHLRQAAMLYAALARRCLEPTFRLTEDGNPYTLLPQRQLDRLAATLLEREIRCLELLVKQPPAAGCPRTRGQLISISNGLRHSGPPASGRLLAVRFMAVHFLHDALQHRATGTARTLVPRHDDWQSLDHAVESATDHLVRTAQPAPLAADEFAFALDCRARFLELCMEEDIPQGEILRKHVAAAAGLNGPLNQQAGIRQYDRLLAARSKESEALQFAGETQQVNQLQSLEHYGAAAHPGVAHLQTPWARRFPELSQRVRTLLRRITSEAPPPASPNATPPDHGRIRDAAHGVWLLHRQPNWFGRIPLMVLGAAATLLLGLALWFSRNPAVINALDFELAAVPPITGIHALAPGTESDPSLWVAMPTGVRVKAPGENFYWQQITSDDDRLMSDDVRRIAVGTEHVAYLCAIDDRRMGISISSAPSAPPGVWPDLGLTDWRTLIGVNAFGQVADGDITTVRQPGRSGPVIFGTRRDHLGVYDVQQRQWLDASALNAALPREAGAILDLAVLPLEGSPLLAVATENGIAWGPWANSASDSEDAPITAAGWKSLPGDRLPTAAIPELHWVPDSGNSRLLAFRSSGDGLGVLPVSGPQAGGAQVLISESRVPGLTEETLSRIAYNASDRRLWMEQAAGPMRPARIVVYRENGHELRATDFPPAGNRITDISTDSSIPGSAFAGTTAGLWQLRDDDASAPPHAHSLGLESSRIQRIAAAGAAGLGVVAIDKHDVANGEVANGMTGPDRAAGSIVHLHDVDTPEMRWTTTLGRRRFPGLAADRITSVVGSTGDDRFFLGTREGGVALVEPATREIHAPFSQATAASARQDELRHVRDLALIPQMLDDPQAANRSADRWMVQVSADGRVDRIDLRDPRQWQPVLGTPAGTLATEQLLAAKAFREELFLGSSSQLTSYSMTARGWRDRAPVSGLAELFVSDDALWALSREGNRDTLLTLAQNEPAAADAEPQPERKQPLDVGPPAKIPEQWQKRFEAFRAFDHTDQRVAVVTLGGALETAGAGPGSTTIVAPKFLPAGEDAPSLATLRDELLFVTPVIGGIGRYHRTTRQWDTIALPEKVEPGQITRLHANATGLWLVDAQRQLHLNRYQTAGGELAGWTVWAEGVVEVDWSEAGAVWLSESGEVRQITAAGETLLVGPGFDADVMADTAAVTEFEGILCVAVKDRVGHYRLTDHLWYESRPEPGAGIRRLIPTDDFLYALTDTGRLLRTPDVITPAWTAVNPLLTTDAVLPEVRFQRPGREQADSGFPRGELTIAQAVSLETAIGLLVPGLGAFVISDKAPEQPVWIRAQSLGLPPAAQITAAAELDGDLILGTRAHGVWCYQRLIAGGITLPDMWLPLPPLENPVTPIRTLVTLADQPDALGILTDAAAFLLRRQPDRTWAQARRLNRFTPTQLAADGDGLLLCEMEPGGATWLRSVDLSGNLTTLIGAPVPQPGRTTQRIAFDSGADLLYRLDDAGLIAAYDERAHAWHDASVTAPEARIRELFFSAGKLRAWSPPTQQLFEHSGRQWQLSESPRQQAAITQLQWDAAAMVVRRETQQIELIEANRRTTLLPAAARDFPADWEQVTHLAELGPWLIVSARAHGLFACDQSDHHWVKVSDVPADECEIATLDPEGRPAAYFLRTGGELQRLVATAGTVPRLLPAPLPNGETAVSLHRFTEGVVARTASGRLWQPSPDGTPARLRLAPRSLSTAEIPRLRAVTEFAGHLLVAFPGRESGTVGIYDPERLQWQTLAISEGSVRRFLRISDGNQPRLFAEVDRPGKAGDETTRQLVALLPQLPGRDWQYVAINGNLLDLAADERSIWSVGEDHRIQRLSVAALRWQPGGLETGDTAPAAMESAHVIGDTLIALLSDQTIWHYSLTDLRWHRHLPERNITTLVVSSDEVFAIEKGTGAFHHYNRTRSAWEALPARGFGKTIVLGGKPGTEPAPPQWQITQEKGQPVITWRTASAAKEQESHPVRLEDLRFDFNRYRRIEIRDGTLWAQTLARRNRDPVIRKFSLQQQTPVETATGDVRFRIPVEESTAALAEGTSLELTGERFSLDPQMESEQGTWPAIDSADGKPRYCRVLMHRLGLRSDQSADIAPMLDGAGGVAFDIDHWSVIAASGNQFAAATRAGLLAFTLDAKNPAITRRVFQPAVAPVDRMISRDGEIVARTAGSDTEFHALRRDEPAWRRLVDGRHTAAVSAFEDAASLRDCGRFLTGWEVVRRRNPDPEEPAGEEEMARQANADSRLLRVVSVQPKKSVPVTLGKGGFGFDQWRGIELTPTAIRGYTPDGRVTIPRKPQPQDGRSAPWLIEPPFAFADRRSGRVTTDPADNSLVLLSGAGAGQTAWKFDEGQWSQLEAPQQTQLLSRLGETLHESDGWTWKADDTLTFGRPPFDKEPLAARFNSQSGQFSFDAIRAVKQQGDSTWLATDAGLLEWKNGSLTGAAPIRLPVSEQSLAAAFVVTPEGTDYLELKQGEAAARLFRLAAKWTPADTAEDRLAVQTARGWLLHGAMWRLRQDEANPDPEAGRTDRRFQRPEGDDPERVRAARLTADGRWSFEALTAIAGAAASPLLGSPDGCHRLTDLRDPGNGHWLPTPVRSGVLHLLQDEGRLHVVHDDDTEIEYDSRTLAERGRAKTSYEVRMRRLHTDDRWQWERTAKDSLEITFRESPMSDPVSVRFTDQRFDFDDVRDVGALPQDSLLATAGGFLTRPTAEGKSSDVHRQTALPAIMEKDRPQVFPLTWQGRTRTLVEHPAGRIFAWSVDGWEQFDEATSTAVLAERSQQVARDDYWNIRRGDDSLSFAATVEPEKPQPVQFSAGLGGFRCDSFRDVLIVPHEKSVRYLVATAGGLCFYTPQKRLEKLTADLTGDAVPDVILNVWRTAWGPLIETRSEGEAVYLLHSNPPADDPDQPPAAGQTTWKTIPAEKAQELLDASRKTVDRDPQGWSVARTLTAPAGPEAYRLTWQGEPVMLEDGEHARFHHDRIESIAWHEEELWLSAAGGVSRVSIDAATGRLRPTTGRSLWVRPFLQTPATENAVIEGRLYSIRPHMQDGGAHLAVRQWRDGRSVAWTFEPAQQVWRSVEQTVENDDVDDPRPVVTDVLHTQPRLGRWRLVEPGRVVLDPDPQRFHLPDAGPDGEPSWSLFTAGTFSFWNIDPSITADGEALAWHGKAADTAWWIATAGGLLRLDPQTRQPLRLYARTLSGEPLTDITHVNIDSQADTAIALSSTHGPRVLGYRADRDGWEFVETDWPGRNQPLQSAWLDIRRDAADKPVIRFREELTDQPAALVAGSIFAEGRFRFDLVRSFAAGDGYTLLTPMGIIRLNAGGEITAHQAAAFSAELAELDRLITHERSRYLTDRSGTVWKETGKGWQRSGASPQVLQQITRVAENPLFVCRSLSGDRWEFAMQQGDLPRFVPGVSRPQLLQDGRFGFDDLRDMRLDGQILLVATRLGIWHYDLARRQHATLPVDADYFASGGDSGNTSREPMIDLQQFLPLPARDELVVSSGSGQTLFGRTSSGWQQMPAEWGDPDVATRRSFTVAGRRLQLRHEAGGWTIAEPSATGSPRQLWSESVKAGDEPLLQDVVQAGSSLWLPLRSRLLWIRTSRL